MPYKSEVHIAIDENPPALSQQDGTPANPFRGPSNSRGTSPDGRAWFDYVMTYKAGPNDSVRIGPGVFLTEGFTSAAPAWSAKSGMRIKGSGASATTLALSNPTGADRAAIGMLFSGDPGLTGFEASDFTIDCNHASGTSRAIAVYGTHVHLRNLRIVNFGTTVGGTFHVVRLASSGSEDNLMDSCIIEEPRSIAASASCLLAYFGGAAPHRFCIVRNCLFRGAAGDLPTVPDNVYGIAPGPALGFVAEGNQLLHLQAGIYEQADTGIVPDVLIRNNYIRNAFRGINYEGNYPVQRLIVHDNIIEPGANGIGIRATGPTAWKRFGTLIVRRNTIRSVKWDQTPTPETIQHGVYASSATNFDAEFNVIDNLSQLSDGIADQPDITNRRILNNINSAGNAVT